MVIRRRIVHNHITCIIVINLEIDLLTFSKLQFRSNNEFSIIIAIHVSSIVFYDSTIIEAPTSRLFTSIEILEELIRIHHSTTHSYGCSILTIKAICRNCNCCRLLIKLIYIQSNSNVLISTSSKSCRSVLNRISIIIANNFNISQFGLT